MLTVCAAIAFLAPSPFPFPRALLMANLHIAWQLEREKETETATEREREKQPQDPSRFRTSGTLEKMHKGKLIKMFAPQISLPLPSFRWLIYGSLRECLSYGEVRNIASPRLSSSLLTYSFFMADKWDT